ncbi:MAG: DNA polymerase/3'-5' exonuclease PolX [Candidatus Omnitrophica bacterium]|nr:DNA polymerase/3'-5' exonuclease PolX [Candidatus Omnitrophota bacterium]
MDNKEIAIIFFKIADALEVKGENVFRVRAYRTAAQNVLGLARQLSDVYKEDPAKLENIPGIGKDLKEKIIEMVTTSHLEFFTRLMKEFPAGFLDLLDIAGLGPKKVKKLSDELGVKNVNDLEKVCRQGKVAKLEGMGEKSQGKILEAIEHFKKSEGRMLLPEADSCAEEVIAYLKESKNFQKIEKAGSLRRGKETIGDIDILATVKDVKKAMDHFVSYPKTEQVIAKGETKSSISLRNGPQVDLRIIDEGCFGAALVYFTGSKEHNIKIRLIAKNKDLKISEYGVFSIGKSGKETFVAGKTEEELYKKLGMEWIPPELRESSGEIEAAMAGSLPKNLIELKDIRGDLHLHTVNTDGRATVEELVELAEEKGYEYIAITDHSKLVRVANGMDEKRLLEAVDKIRKKAAKVKKLKILAGVEVDILESGELDLKDYALKELDIVIAAVHSHFSLDKEKQTARILKALDNKFVSILAHPSGRLITRRSALQLDFTKVFEKAVQNNIFLEINTHGERIDLNDVNCRLAKEKGARFVINTDAHDASQMGLLKYGIITARRGWLEKSDVLNTYTYEKVVKALKK